MRFNENIYYSRLDYRIPLLGSNYIKRHTYAVLLNFRKKFLIDTGVRETEPQLEALLEEAGLRWSSLDAVINTHSHPDHIGLNRVISGKNRNIIFYAHPEAIPLIEDISRQARERHLIGLLKLVSGDVQGVIPVEDDQILHLGGEVLRVMHTPGHSADSLTLSLEKNKMLITGDSLVDFNHLPNYTDLVHLRASLKRLSYFDFKYFLSAFSGLVERKKRDLIKETLDYLDIVDNLVREKMAETRDVDAIARYVFDRMDLPFAVNHIVRFALAQHIPGSGRREKQ